jgi:threonine aldolase
MAALAAANSGPAAAYGGDGLTQAARARFKELLGENAEAFFVVLGTAANVLCLQAMTRPHNAVLAAASAHINVDECGAPEAHLGCKLMCVDAPEGKLTPELLRPFLLHLGNEHHNQPRVISITQATELGTVYRLEELRALADFAHENGLYLHMDGARLGNAAVALGCGLREMTADVGVDALSFGGTKNGLMFGEAVVFFRPELAQDFQYLRKQAMQLCSKMRFIAAQFLTLLGDADGAGGEGALWRENASQANDMARLLADKISGLPGVRITQPVETNAVFASLAPAAIARLQARFAFYVWNYEQNVVRFMTSFATTEAEVEEFAAAVREEAEKG